MRRLLLVLAVLLSLAMFATPACDEGCRRSRNRPWLEQLPPTDISSVGTTLNGSLHSMMGYDSMEVWFEYWETRVGTPHYETEHQTMTAPGDFSAQATGTMPGTRYAFRLRARAGEEEWDCDEDYFNVP